MRNFRFALAVTAVLGVAAACQDSLKVNNPNNPDLNRIFASPTAAEQVIGNAYNSIHRGTLGGQNDDLETEMLTMGLESYSGLANFDMGVRAGYPRGPINNQRGNSGQVGK